MLGGVHNSYFKHNILSDLQELVSLAVSRRVCPQVNSSLAGVALAGDKNNSRLVSSVVSEGRVAGASHGLHAGV